MILESPMLMKSLEVSNQKFHDPCSFDSLYTSAKFFVLTKTLMLILTCLVSKGKTMKHQLCLNFRDHRKSALRKQLSPKGNFVAPLTRVSCTVWSQQLWVRFEGHRRLVFWLAKLWSFPFHTMSFPFFLYQIRPRVPAAYPLIFLFVRTLARAVFYY